MVFRTIKGFGSLILSVNIPLRTIKTSPASSHLIAATYHASAVLQVKDKLTNVHENQEKSIDKPAESTTSAVEDQSKTPTETVTSSPMDEFFESKENWDKTDILVGRSWRKDDLRLKSNSDLHKLWFVLLKERNMLLTMGEIYKFNIRPSPERIYKVEESMKNLEDVVRERNRAYFELETGETGERRCKYELTRIGLWRLHKMAQHTIPKRLNKEWLEQYPQHIEDEKVDEFLRLYEEKLLNKKKRVRNNNKMYVMALMQRFPNVDRQLLQEQYPDINIEKLSKRREARGHRVP